MTITHLSLGAFVRIPLEGVLIGAALVLLPAKARNVAAVGVGALLGLLTVLKLLDMGFYEVLDRPFDPVTDRAYFGPAVGLLEDSVGHTTAVVVVTIGIVAAVVIPVVTALAVVRLSRLGAQHKTGTLRGVVAVGAAWALLAVFGAPLASSSAAGLAYDQIAAVHDAIEQQDVFAERAAHDAYANTPGNQLLTGLRGKDVIVAFVESYGQVAVEDSNVSPGVDAVLDAGTASLGAAGFQSESGWLTSPTFGGISWLAHSTLQSGLWVDNQLLYNELMTSDRLTLATAFKRAGWRTVADVPSNEKEWPEGKQFYDYDRIYGDGDVGYEGPSFSYASMPDQYTLAAFHRLELTRPHDPLFAEIDLVSSHTPWAPLPHLIGWNQVGDGEVFNSMAADGADPNDVWRSADRVKEAYGQSIEYSLSTLDLVRAELRRQEPRPDRARRPSAGKGRHRRGPDPQRPDCHRRARPRSHGQDCELGLGPRLAAVVGRTVVADGLVPRPPVHRIRPVVDALATPTCAQNRRVLKVSRWVASSRLTR